MHNTYSPWRDLASRAHLELVWNQMGDGLLGLYDHLRQRITLDPRMPRRQMRSVLAHELVHAEHADHRTECQRINLRQEQLADRKAARRLIDIRDLGEAMIACDNHLSAVAVELRVSDSMLRVRRDHLTRTELLYLRRIASAFSEPA